ncbi:MAG: hypothetical protein A2277_16790 [Desulfobacterales bacterium RIFOXYA12_FULL_46_15]|nr:MAG: hypothetical protein A2277_16790 [Desulfobacterales bacterium RIFOXYA12_FULL_46_15]
MKRFADDTYGSTLDKVNTTALGSVEKAFAVKSGFFNSNTAAESQFNRSKTIDRHYLAHEYFNRDWQPFYFSDIMNFPMQRFLLSGLLNYLTTIWAFTPMKPAGR